LLLMLEYIRIQCSISRVFGLRVSGQALLMGAIAFGSIERGHISSLGVIYWRFRSVALGAAVSIGQWALVTIVNGFMTYVSIASGHFLPANQF